MSPRTGGQLLQDVAEAGRNLWTNAMREPSRTYARNSVEDDQWLGPEVGVEAGSMRMCACMYKRSCMQACVSVG